jgi:hypothetical protein
MIYFPPALRPGLSISDDGGCTLQYCMASSVQARIAGAWRLVGAVVVALLGSAAAPTIPAQGSEQVAAVDGLIWAIGTNGENVGWDDAATYCETLAVDGLEDWRLPTLAELETLYEPTAEERGRIESPLVVADCCVWSATSLAEVGAEDKGVLPGPLNDTADYYWGFLFSSGTRYYSLRRFADGEALCVTEPTEG